MVHRLSQMGRYTGTIRTGPGRYSLVIAVPKCTRSLYHFALYLAQIKNLMQLDSLCRFVSDEIVLFHFISALRVQGGPKWHNFLYALTSSNINRFSKLFHCQYWEKICNNTITKYPTTPQVCRYTTLRNVKCVKSSN